MPVGKVIVLVGMSERTSRQAIEQVAKALFEQKAAERVMICAMPKLRAAMHLDTVFTFADRDWLPAVPGHHGPRADLLGLPESNKPGGIEIRKDEGRFAEWSGKALRVRRCASSKTGGNAYMRSATQWDSGANLVCARRGVVFAYDRNTYTNALLAQGRRRGIEIERSELAAAAVAVHCL